MRNDLLLGLVKVFVPVSLMSVGGGQAVLAEIHRQVVAERGWLNEGEFVADYALSRMAPGPSSLIVMLIGAQVSGAAGACVALLSMFLPSSLLVFVVARVWRRHQAAEWRMNVERGLAPIASGLVLATSLTLLQSMRGGWLAWVVAGVATVCLLRWRLHPLLLIAAGAGIFLGWAHLADASGSAWP